MESAMGRSCALFEATYPPEKIRTCGGRSCRLRSARRDHAAAAVAQAKPAESLLRRGVHRRRTPAFSPRLRFSRQPRLVRRVGEQLDECLPHTR